MMRVSMNAINRLTCSGRHVTPAIRSRRSQCACRNFERNLNLSSSCNGRETVSQQWEKWFEDDIPRITVPSKSMKFIARQQLKKQMIAEREQSFRGSGPLVISCKRDEFNHFIGHRYPRGDLDVKFLATHGWKHNKSVGDWMIIQPFMHLPAFHGTCTSSFAELKIWPELDSVLKKMLVTQPTYVQEHSIPETLAGNNVLLAAETGSGKTLAYLLPLLQKIKILKSEVGALGTNKPKGIILLPSKELVDQVKRICEAFCQPLELTVQTLAGKKGSEPVSMDILIATPGALAPLAYHKVLNLNHVQCLVLDEGDTLMDDSFSPTVLDIIQRINVQTENIGSSTGCAQVIIAAATMPRGVKNILGDLIDMDAIKTIQSPKLHYVLPHVKQRFERVKPSTKSDVVTEAVRRNHERKRPTLVFCNGSSAAHHIGYRLEDLSIPYSLLTGVLPTQRRDGRFDAFQHGDTNVMIATDVASRGLDTTRVKNVINYDFPNFVSDYIHRIGRVGRVGSPAKCMASSYVAKPWEVDLLWEIEKSIRKMTAIGQVDANIRRTLVKKHHGQAGVAFMQDMDFDK